MVILNYIDYVQCSNTRKKRYNHNQPQRLKNHELQNHKTIQRDHGNKGRKKPKTNPTKTQLLGSLLFAIAACTLRVHLSHVLKLWP